MLFSIRIAGTGIYVPQTAVKAEDLDGRLGLAPGTTLARNGVRTRYFANAEETASMMGAAAITMALEQAGIAATELDAIVFAGVMSEQPMPCTAILLHQRLQATANCACLDINAGCVGFLRATEVAAGNINAGLWNRVAVVAVEIASKGVRWDDLDTCTLFGDGAAAAIMTLAQAGEGIALSRTQTFSQAADFCEMRAGGSRWNMRTPPEDDDAYLFAMKGRNLLRLVQQHFPDFLRGVLEEARALGAPVELVIPHQASHVGLALLRKQLAAFGIPAVELLADFGNQVSVSIPLTLHMAIASGQLQRGQTALLVGTAAGVTLSGMVIRY